MLAGAAFGASGAVYQSVTRNPLGSPDIIGFTTVRRSAPCSRSWCSDGSEVDRHRRPPSSAGSASPSWSTSLSYRGGGVQGYRLILVGIGISAVLASFISYLLLKAENILTPRRPTSG